MAYTVYMKTSKLVKRTYRITEENDRKVKKLGKKNGGESNFIRTLIDNS